MAGRKGRSGGHNRLSVEEHLLRGTFNPTRHGSRAPALIPAPNPNGIPPDLLDGITGRGAGFVEECWATHRGWTVPRSLLLREAGLLIDQLEAARGKPKEEPAVRRALLSVLAALELRAAPVPVAPLPPSKWSGESA